MTPDPSDGDVAPGCPPPRQRSGGRSIVEKRLAGMRSTREAKTLRRRAALFTPARTRTASARDCGTTVLRAGAVCAKAVFVAARGKNMRDQQIDARRLLNAEGSHPSSMARASDRSGRGAALASRRAGFGRGRLRASAGFGLLLAGRLAGGAVLLAEEVLGLVSTRSAMRRLPRRSRR